MTTCKQKNNRAKVITKLQHTHDELANIGEKTHCEHIRQALLILKNDGITIITDEIIETVWQMHRDYIEQNTNKKEWRGFVYNEDVIKAGWVAGFRCAVIVAGFYEK